MQPDIYIQSQPRPQPHAVNLPAPPLLPRDEGNKTNELGITLDFQIMHPVDSGRREGNLSSSLAYRRLDDNIVPRTLLVSEEKNNNGRRPKTPSISSVGTSGKNTYTHID